MTKAELNYYAGYVRGVTVAISDNAFKGPSSLSSRVFKRDELVKELSKEFKCSEEDIVLEKSALTLSDYLKLELGWDAENAWNIGRRLGFVIGKPESLYTIKDDEDFRERYSGYSRGGGPFYFIEELFVVYYKQIAVLFIVGNDE